MKLLLTGGAGLMGTMFRQRFSASGHDVTALDLAEGADRLSAAALEKALPGTDAVMLCVPFSAVESAARSVAAFMGPEQLLLDICSVKVRPMRVMEEAFAGPVIGTHPLFGPGPAPEHTRVALTRGKNASSTHLARVEALFASIGCETFRCAPEEHDAACARIQSLNFAVDAAYFAALAKHEGAERFLTPSCVRVMDAARKMLLSDAAMFLEFTAANPFFPAALREFLDLLDRADQEGRDGLQSLVADAAKFYK